MVRGLLAAAMMLGLMVAGCLEQGVQRAAQELDRQSESEQERIVSKYDDADEREAKVVAGQSVEQRTFEVPLGLHSIRVAAAWSIAGQGSIVLQDPVGRPVQEATIQGTDSYEDESWYQNSMAIPGGYKLTVTVQGSGAYAFGFYLE